MHTMFATATEHFRVKMARKMQPVCAFQLKTKIMF
jgi:hypothetical protein